MLNTQIRCVHIKGAAREAYYFFVKEKFLLYPRTRASKFPSQGSRREYFHVTFSQTQSAESRGQEKKKEPIPRNLPVSFPPRPVVILVKSCLIVSLATVPIRAG